MNTELSKEEIANLQAYFKELRANRFTLSDTSDVNRLAKKLADTQSGWLDTDIFIKTLPVNGYTSYPDNYFMQYYPAYYNYLQSIPRHFWFTITIPQGVSIDDPFIFAHRREHFENIERLKKLIISKLGGEILYYEIDSQCIFGIIKISQPVVENAKMIQQAMQSSIDELFMMFNTEQNRSWIVSLKLIDVYDDIRVTLQNKDKYLDESNF